MERRAPSGGCEEGLARGQYRGVETNGGCRKANTTEPQSTMDATRSLAQRMEPIVDPEESTVGSD